AFPERAAPAPNPHISKRTRTHAVRTMGHVPGAAAPTADATRVTTSAADDGSSRTILVVDDEASIAQAVAARLRSEGFIVHIARDGPSAVTTCDELRPDLVVLDLMLPGLDGLEVCR